ncbi:hypothetical protein N7G274_008943 [Stereocaulon virgatum]|uniref:Uncharacterized protein n=1 Tax=Stereocaulon virgatum TaxID=373712 RepID=A0ABR3ZX99_9LECA
MLENGYQVLQNDNAVFIGPVMNAPAKGIHVCSFERLFRREIVRHKLHAASQHRRNLRLAFRNDLGKLWDDAFNGGNMLRKGNTHPPMTASNVDEDLGTHRCPRISIHQMDRLETFIINHHAYCSCKALRSLWKFAEFLEERVPSVVRVRKALVIVVSDLRI